MSCACLVYCGISLHGGVKVRMQSQKQTCMQKQVAGLCGISVACRACTSLSALPSLPIVAGPCWHSLHAWALRAIIKPVLLARVRAQKHAKEQAATEAWRQQHSRQERKKRYREQGQAEKRASAKKHKRGDD